MKIALVALPIGGVGFCVLSVIQAAGRLGDQNTCVQHIKQVDLGVLVYANETSSYPTNLQAITNYCTDPNSFVCPGTGHRPGALSNASQWTDCVLVPRTYGDLMTNANLVAIYCAPEHHHNRYGVIARTDGRVDFVSPQDFWMRVNPPKEKTPTKRP
ncbi:MAG: hypothetical protein NTW03_13315 [Verrucomicrobia bacterium]|nr:hypothetical protein [Verrucomicrobiota bacterium]